MRRDVYIQNDSGGLSVVTGAAVDAVIADGREDDEGFVRRHEVLLLELYGDDSMPVRVVVDEPLTREEEAQWLARATNWLEVTDGRVLVMGGYDPRILEDWREAHTPHEDCPEIAVTAVPNGTWRVDVYAHIGSMNGRYVVEEVCGLPLHREPEDVTEIGFVVHLARVGAGDEAPEVPEGGLDAAGRRRPEGEGLSAGAPDPRAATRHRRLTPWPGIPSPRAACAVRAGARWCGA